MKPVLFKTILFLLPLILIGVLANLKYKPFFLERAEPVFSKAQTIRGKSFKYLLLGDSHAEKIRDSSFPPGTLFNFQMNSDNYKAMRAKLEYALKTSNFEGVVLEIDPPMLSSYRNNNNNLAYISKFVSYRHLAEIYDIDVFDYFNLRNSNYFPIFYPEYSSLFRNLVYNDLRHNSFKEFLSTKRRKKKVRPADSVWLNMSSSQRAQAAKLRTQEQLINPHTQELEYQFRKIMEICKSNSLKIIGLKFPLSEEYLEEAQQYPLEKIDRIYASAGFHEILDFSTWGVNHPHYFSNSDHLSEAGAYHFSRTLAKLLP